MGEHVWVPANRTIKWPHCGVCFVIKRRDDGNGPCRGPGKMRPLEQPIEPTDSGTTTGGGK